MNGCHVAPISLFCRDPRWRPHRPASFRRRTLTALVFLVFLSAGLVSACGSRVQRPEVTLERYVDAIRSGDCDAAYALLDDRFHARMTATQYATYCQENASALTDQAERLANAMAEERAEVNARLPLDSARVVTLTHEGGSWYLAENIPLLHGGDTPVETLQAVAMFFESPAVNDLSMLLSETSRNVFLAEMKAIAQALREGADAELLVFGDAAIVTFGGLTVRLGRENGIWRVDSIQQDSAYHYGYDPW